jgi:hypothetical protein
MKKQRKIILQTLRGVARKKNISNEVISARTGIGKSSVVRMLSGNDSLGFDNFLKISKAVEIDLFTPIINAITDSLNINAKPNIEGVILSLSFKKGKDFYRACDIKTHLESVHDISIRKNYLVKELHKAFGQPVNCIANGKQGIYYKLMLK